MNRAEIIELLNAALSAEYNSFIGHALASNPYVAPEWERDLALFEELREDENDLSRAVLVQFSRYRAGPTLGAFRLWKEDLNFLSLEWLIIRAHEESLIDLAAAEARCARLPDDAELRATLDSIVITKKRHVERLSKAAEKMKAGRDARRATQHAVTVVKVPGLAGPATKKPAAAAAPKPPGPPGAPKAPGAPKPPGAPKAPRAPTPPGAAPKAPPLPPGAKAPAAPPPPAPPAPAAPPAPRKSSGAPPLPPGFKKPGS